MPQVSGGKPKFYTDEHIRKAIAVQLRQRGVDVVRCQEVGMRQADDPDHLEAASREGRVLITKDTDFLRLHSQWVSQDRGHAGIIFVDNELSIGQVVFVVELFHVALSAEEMKSQLWYAKEFVSG